MKISLTKQHMAGFLLAGLVAVCDQLSKQWIIAAGKASLLPIKVLPFFDITLVFNKGISFGMLAHSQGVVIFMLPVCLGIIIFMLCFWLVKAEECLVIFALGLIIGGAVGNMIDRLHFGVVTDFLDFHISHYHWPAFNFADSTIFIGVVIFVVTNIIAQNKSEETSA